LVEGTDTYSFDSPRRQSGNPGVLTAWDSQIVG
jgi:hypothetical protein